MQDRIDALLAAGAQNMWPKFTMYVPRTVDDPAKHVVVAEVIDGACYLTPEGKELLNQPAEDIVDAEIVSITKKPKAGKKPKEVEPEPIVEPEFDLDLDAGAPLDVE